MDHKLPFDKQAHLVTGGEVDPFLPKLLQAINNATEIDIAVGFIKSTGMELIYEALQDALEQDARVRVLAGDYLNVTDPDALRSLLVLKDLGAETRIFKSDGLSFHMKAYIFTRREEGTITDGRAFVGSSNISKSALRHGLEWNLRVEWKENPERFAEIRQKYERIFNDSRTQILTNKWIDAYSEEYQQQRFEALAVSEPGADEELPPPQPNELQRAALEGLEKTREEGNKRGLVVMASGTGKTWLAAFDTVAMGAKKVLFVAHREEILNQAEKTFVRIRPEASIGRYAGQQKDAEADLLFASIQTLGKLPHLRRFPEDHFDYIVVDEFHHAAAMTYQKLLGHFSPQFLLGLTATPDRTDQADILSLCDDNLVMQQDLFDAIEMDMLCPFHYYGIADSEVDYSAIPWRNGKFDPQELSNKLATNARASHVLRTWADKKQQRTMAFCVSTRHADYMARFFDRNGIKAVSVHSKSNTRRNEALRMLREGEIDVIFSVDLFNEGVDLPAIDTVLMIRPTESKILFLQQLGRGLRISHDKDFLVVLDFIGNHVSFFKKYEAIFNIDKTNQARRQLLDEIENETVELPAGCYLNYDLQAIDFMKKLIQTRADKQLELYESLKTSLDRRPTLSEFYLSGGQIATVRKEYGHWLRMVEDQEDLSNTEATCLEEYSDFFAELEKTQMTKCYKMVLIEAMIDLDGFRHPPSISELAKKSFKILDRRRRLRADLPDRFKVDFGEYDSIEGQWISYWKSNPINAWIGGNRKDQRAWFGIDNGKFVFKGDRSFIDEDFERLVMEMVNYRFEQYQSRLSRETEAPQEAVEEEPAGIPLFEDLAIACGSFRTSTHDIEAARHIRLPSRFGRLNPSKNFVARATGNSMDGGKNPIQDGDYLLLELNTSESAGSISNQLMVIERQDVSGDDQYLLRYVRKNGPGDYTLEAWNEDYDNFRADSEMKTRARVRAILDPIDVFLHRSLDRKDIPDVFGLEFNPSLWNTGHICPKEISDQILLVTLNKQGQQESHKYRDYFAGSREFHWQSQTRTGPSTVAGKRVIQHETNGSDIHLFVRKNKLEGGKAAPFYYCGRVHYLSHEGGKPMSVTFELEDSLPPRLRHNFVLGE